MCACVFRCVWVFSSLSLLSLIKSGFKLLFLWMRTCGVIILPFQKQQQQQQQINFVICCRHDALMLFCIKFCLIFSWIGAHAPKTSTTVDLTAIYIYSIWCIKQLPRPCTSVVSFSNNEILLVFDFEFELLKGKVYLTGFQWWTMVAHSNASFSSRVVVFLLKKKIDE